MKVRNKIEILRKLVFIFCFCIVVSFASVSCFVGSDKYIVRSDFISFITGARIVVKGKGEDLYDLGVQRKYQSEIVGSDRRKELLPYRNPPLLTIFFIPFFLIPTFEAYWLYTLTIVLVTLLISWLSTKAFKKMKGSYWYLLPFIFYPSFIAIFAGQISTFLLLFFVLIYFFIKEDAPFFAGIVGGLLLLKPQYIVGLPFVFVLTSKKGRFLEGLLLSSLFVVIGSVCVSGFGFVENYLKILVETENPLYGTRATSMFTFYSAMSQLTSFGKINLLLSNVTFYLLAIVVFYKSYKKHLLEINFAALVFLTLVFCIHGVIVDMALLLLPLWLLINIYKSEKENYLGNIIVIFIIIFSSLFFVLKLSFVVPFVFLLSVLLLFRKFEFRHVFERE